MNTLMEVLQWISSHLVELTVAIAIVTSFIVLLIRQRKRARRTGDEGEGEGFNWRRYVPSMDLIGLLLKTSMRVFIRAFPYQEYRFI